MAERTEERPVESRNPVTGEVWREWTAATAEQVQDAVERARVAQRAWASKPVPERARILTNLRHRLVDEREALTRLIQRENGKPRVEALLEVLAAAEFAGYYAKEAPKLLRTRSMFPSSLAVWRKRIHLEKEPLGVVGVITPWNYPLLLASGLVLPALAAGNAVVIKPSEYTPSSTFRLGEILVDAGLPEGLMTVLPGAAKTGAALVKSGIDKIFFVGSERGGRAVYESAARQLLPCSLELGGSDPAIVLEDADLENAARGLMWGRFSNGSQTCVAPKRIFVIDSVYDRFLEALSKRVARLEVGDEGDVGPLIRPVQRESIERQLEAGVSEGARIVTRASAPEGETFFAPTIVSDVPDDSTLLREETFGPLLPVVPVENEEAAIRRANDSTYGLSASVWSRDISRARRIARRLETGSVTVNDSVIVPAMTSVAYGGRKASGIGVSHGPEGLMACVHQKPVIVDRFASWPETYWHPYTKRKTDGIEEFLVFSHAKGLFRRLAAGVRAVLRLYF